jgi:hypothetical protein
VLPSGSAEAQRRILELVEAEHGATPVPMSPASAQSDEPNERQRRASL